MKCRTILIDVEQFRVTVSRVSFAARSSMRPLILAWVSLVAFVGLMPLLSPPAAQAASEVTLEYSWPEEGFEMWLPPQQGRLDFSAPVRTSTMTLELRKLDSPGVPVDQVTRLTRGEAETSVIFRFPELDPGRYELAYQVDAAKGPGQVRGTIEFALGPEFTAPGGGNHRHDGSHIEYDTPWTFSLRVLLVLSASLLLFAWHRGRLNRRSLFDAVLPRVGALLMAVYAASAGATVVLVSVSRYPDTPLEAVLSSAALWIFFPLFAAAGLLVVSGRRDAVALGITVAALVLSGFAFQHGDQVWLVFATLILSLLLLTASLTYSFLFRVLAHEPTESGLSAWSRAGIALVVSVLLSLAMLLTHARGLVFLGDFDSDFKIRLFGAFVALLGMSALWPASRVAHPRLRLIICAVPFLLVVAGSAALLWLPPPASGL